MFVGANCAVPVAIDDAWVYGGQAIDAATTPLLVDDAGVVYAATRTYPDGREALAMTFSQSPTSLPSLELAYGVFELGDARPVHRRASCLPGSPDRRLLPGERPLRDERHLSDHGGRSAGVHELAGGAPGRSADGPVPRRVRVQRPGRAGAGPRRPDRQGARAGTDVRVDQPHLGPRRDGRDELRECVLGAEPEQSVRHRIRPVSIQRPEPGDAQHDGTGQRRGDARRVRRRHPPGDQRCDGALRGQPVAERRLLQRAGPDAAPDPAPRDGSRTSTSRSRPSGSPSTKRFDRRPASATRRSSTSRARSSFAT